MDAERSRKHMRVLEDKMDRYHYDKCEKQWRIEQNITKANKWREKENQAKMCLKKARNRHQFLEF